MTPPVWSTTVPRMLPAEPNCARVALEVPTRKTRSKTTDRKYSLARITDPPSQLTCVNGKKVVAAQRAARGFDKLRRRSDVRGRCARVTCAKKWVQVRIEPFGRRAPANHNQWRGRQAGLGLRLRNVRRMADPTNMSRQLVVRVPHARPDGRRQQDDDCQQSKGPVTSVMSPFNHSIRKTD